MKVTVLIAVCRPGADLTETLAGVQGQTVTEWDVVVVEDGHAGTAENVIQEFGASAQRSVRFEKLHEPLGATAVRNRLLELATGDMLAFLDAEDSWMPRHLANAAQQFSAGADVVVSDIRSSELKGNKPANDISVPAQLTTKPARTLFSRDSILTSSCLVARREVTTKAGPFDSRFQVGEVRDYWLRCAINGARFGATHRATCRWAKRSHASSGRALLIAENNVQFYEKHRDLPAVPAALRRRLLSASLVTLGRLLRPTDPARAARCFWRAWSLQPVHVQTLGQFALTGWRFASPGENPIKPDR